MQFEAKMIDNHRLPEHQRRQRSTSDKGKSADQRRDWRFWISLALVAITTIALPISGPWFYGGLPSQIFLLSTTWFLATQIKNYERIWWVGAPALLWCFMVVPPVLSHTGDTGEAIRMLRTLGVMPAFSLCYGFFMARANPKLLTVALVLSAIVNMVLMYQSAVMSGEIALANTGQMARTYANIVTGEDILATGATANCLAAFILSAWILPARSAWSRAVYTIIFVAGASFGVYTGTRSPVVASVLVLLLQYFAAITNGRRVWLRVFVSVAGIFLAVIVGNMLVPAESLVFLDRFSVDSLSDSSFSGRSVIWEANWDKILMNPGGYGSLETNEYDAASSHNLLLEMIILTGWIPGLFVTLFVLFVSTLSGRYLFAANVSDNVRRLSAAVLIATMFNMVEATIRSSQQAFNWTLVLFGAFLAVAGSKDLALQKNEGEQGSKLQIDPVWP